MSETLFTSDTHFQHKNIIKYCGRPFETVEEMTEGLVDNWNKEVGPKDHVWHLGDVTFGPFDLNRLNGIKHLVRGNHDPISYIQGYFVDILPYHELKGILPKNRALALFHYPIESWNGKFHGAIHLHGHSHGTTDNTGLLRFDMGVDCWDMKPVPIERVLELVPIRKEQEAVTRDAKFKQLSDRATEDAINDIDALLKSLTSKMNSISAYGIVGGCTCMTKTPELACHSEDCRYRMICEVSEEAEKQITEIRKAIGK